MLLEGGLGVLLTGPAYEAVEIGEAARELSGGIELLEGIADVLIGQALTAGGDWEKAERDLLRARGVPAHRRRPARGHGGLRLRRARLDVDGALRARAEGRSTASSTRRAPAGALAQLAYPLAVRSQLGFRRGAWTAALRRRRGGRPRLARDRAGERALLRAADAGRDRGRARALRRRARPRVGVHRPRAAHGDAGLRPVRARRARRDRAGRGADRRRRRPSTRPPATSCVAHRPAAPGELFWTVELVEAHARGGATEKAAVGAGAAGGAGRAGAPARPAARSSSAAARSLATDHDEAVAHFERALEPTTRRRARRSSWRARSSRTASACGGASCAPRRATTCAPRSTRSSGSARSRGPSAPARSCGPAAARRPARSRCRSARSSRRTSCRWR